MAVAGVSAYAITAVLSEANLRMGTVAKNPVEAIQKGLTALKTDHRMLDGALILASSWQSDRENELTALSPNETSDSVSWPVALLGDDDEDPAKGAFVAHTATFRIPIENPDPKGD